MKNIVIYGTRTCSDCIRTKYWLQAHNVAFEELFLEDDDKYIEEVLKITGGNMSTPVVILPNGTKLIEPTNEELAKYLTLA
jgi:glutaredoxin